MPTSDQEHTSEAEGTIREAGRSRGESNGPSGRVVRLSRRPLQLPVYRKFNTKTRDAEGNRLSESSRAKGGLSLQMLVILGVMAWNVCRSLRRKIKGEEPPEAQPEKEKASPAGIRPYKPSRGRPASARHALGSGKGQRMARRAPRRSLANRKLGILERWEQVLRQQPSNSRSTGSMPSREVAQAPLAGLQ